MTTRLPATVLALILSAATAAAQSNDACTTATPLRSAPFTITAVTTTATDDAADPLPSCGDAHRNVWYRYTAKTDVSLDLDTAGSDYISTITVYTGSCGALTEIACNTFGPRTEQGHVIVPLDAGQSVLIAVSNNHGSGNANLRLAGRKSQPRYRNPKSLTEIVRSSDPNPYGGSNGWMMAATALTPKSLAFASQGYGLFVDTNGVLTTVVHSGTPSPVGGTFAAVGTIAVAGDDVYFNATLEGGPLDDGIFVLRNGVVLPFVVPGAPAPDGGTYRSFSGGLAAADDGTVLFLARTSLNVTRDNLIAFDGIAATVLAKEGDASPCGGTIRTIGSRFTIDELGTRAAFVAQYTGGDTGVFTADGATVAAIACQDAATPIGGTHRRFGDYVGVNGLGEVYFVSQVDDGPGVIQEAVWVSVGGTTTLVGATGTSLSTGETIADVRLDQRLATNAAGDVVFTAGLGNPKGRSIIRRAHLAAQPAAVVLDDSPCPAGGLFRSIDDDLRLASSGAIGFQASCDGGRGTFRKPLADSPATIALVSTTTAIGSGFTFGTPQLNATGRAAFGGSRLTLQHMACTPKGCAAPVGVAVPGAPITNLPGEILSSILTETLGGAGTTSSFVAATSGIQGHAAVVRTVAGGLESVAATGQPLPGGIGTITGFSTIDLSGQAGAVGVGTDTITFLAEVDHPTASQGLFAATEDGLTTIALAGDVAPNGELFEEIGMPTIRRKSIVFAARTDSATCVYGVRAPGRPLVALACTGDAMPAPIGGTIDEFITPPSGNARNFVITVALNDASATECLVRYRNGTPKVVRCTGDTFINGLFFQASSFQDANAGPIADANLKGFVFRHTDDDTNTPILLAQRQSLVPVIRLGQSAPLSGGAIIFEEFHRASMADRMVLIPADIDGGSAVSAVFKATLP